MSLTQDKINRLKKLTALDPLSPPSIDSVLDSFSELQGVDTSAISETRRSGSQTLTFREDVVRSDEHLPDALLDQTKQRVVGHQIALASIMHGE